MFRSLLLLLSFLSYGQSNPENWESQFASAIQRLNRPETGAADCAALAVEFRSLWEKEGVADRAARALAAEGETANCRKSYLLASTLYRMASRFKSGFEETAATLEGLNALHPPSAEEIGESFKVQERVRQNFSDKGIRLASVDIGVPFARDVSTLSAEAEAFANRLGEALRGQYPTARFLIIGHTDKRGTAEHNLKLSRARAESVRVYLGQRYAISASKLRTEGLGFSEMKRHDNSEEAHAINRRVEVRLLAPAP